MQAIKTTTRANLPAWTGKLIIAGLLCCPVAIQAQGSVASWPAKTVRIVAPFGAGGTADALGRIVAQKLSEQTRQQFVVENRAGAGGAIGSELIARSAPDGYNLVVSGIASHVLAPLLSKLPYDPMKDFTHIALFGGPPAVFAVNPGLPVKDVKELIALARSKPRSISYGSPGNGTQGHLVAEYFRQQAGIEIQHVPYKGASGAVADLIAGHLPMISSTLSTAATQIKAGKARAIALSSASRLADYPDVPTLREAGFPDLVATVWFSLSGPAGMPADVVNRLNAEVRRILALPDVRERLRPEGIEPANLDAPAFTAFVAAELKRWAPVVKASGAKAD